jgi:tetratricopeptide (TPR) repeat protein
LQLKIARCRFLQRTCAIALLFALFTPAARSQAQDVQLSATFEVTVCDSQHRPLPGATVSVERDGGAEPIVAQTDSEGRHTFSPVFEGTYTVVAKLAGYRDTSKSSIFAAPTHAIPIVLVLEPMPAAPTKKASHAVEYSDEPQFTVAGVTDPTSLGGHGSDTVMRTKETLAKDAAALNRSDSRRAALASTASAGTAGNAASYPPLSEDFSEDVRIGKRLLDDGEAGEALAYLERAAKLNPDDFDAEYALALACERTHDFARSAQITQALIARGDRADLHELLADVFENERQAVEAAHEYERAAKMDPSEPNLFAWGAELLLHLAYVPAAEVFQKAHRLYPKSARALVGLGVASYAAGQAEKGIRELIEACDLEPSNANAYLFLGRMQDTEKSESPQILARFKRFVALQPQNAMANYYYAVGLAKASDGIANSGRIEALFLKSIELDPRLGDAYLHLGILYSSRKDFPKAVAAYEKAIENDPQSAEAHFRLAQAYRQMGKLDEARNEIQRYDEASKKQEEETERERREIGRFVYTLRGQPGRTPETNPQ